MNGSAAPVHGSSAGYSHRLTQGQYRGNLNLQNKPDGPLAVLHKVRILAGKIRAAKSVVLHSGAGLSTAAGVADFRGPNGIWTKEREAERMRLKEQARIVADARAKMAAAQKRARPVNLSPSRSVRARTNGLAVAKNEKVEIDGDIHPGGDPMAGATKREQGLWGETQLPSPVSVEDAMPTLAHMVIAGMVRDGFVDYIVSQNVDCLHIRSGVPRERLSELHGNLFMEWCEACKKEFQRDYEIQTAGMKPTGNFCPICAGELHDKTIDWESVLPEPDYKNAVRKSKKADLNIVVGSSCQMVPSMNLPFKSRHKDNSVIINLSQTVKDGDAGLIIRAPCDTVFALLAHELDIAVEPYRHRAKLVLDVAAASTLSVGTTRLGLVMHSSQGGLWMRIPYVRAVQFEVAGTQIAPGGNAPHFRGVCTVACREGDVMPVRSVVWLENGQTVELAVNFRGVPVAAWMETTVKEKDYPAVLKETIRRAKVMGMDGVNLRQMEKNVMSWYVRAGRPRFSMCVLCREEVYSSGMGWEVRVRGHIRKCLTKALTKREVEVQKT